MAEKKVTETPTEPTPQTLAQPAGDGTIKFNDPETAAAYKTTYTVPVKIHVPGVWAGSLADLPLKVADVLFAQGSGAIVKK